MIIFIKVQDSSELRVKNEDNALFTFDEEEKWTCGVAWGFCRSGNILYFDLGCGYTGVCFCVTHSLCTFL